jgi:hypothetical protein
LYIFTRNNNNYLFKSYYRSYCLILRRVIREAKRKYYNRLIASAEDKIKATWNIIDIETGWKNNKDCLPKTFQNNNKKINTEEAAQF